MSLEGFLMIKINGLYENLDYQETLESFNKSSDSNKWRLFKDIHLVMSNNKCPICECSLDNPIRRNSRNGSILLEATIDHYRPKDSTLYPLLKYDHKNYLLMCSDCNNAYKGNQFPLHSSTPNRNISARCTDEISDERPLITNPIRDDIFELFQLVFRLTPSGRKVLELMPRHDSGYLNEKARETIRVFSLGLCEDPTHVHSSQDVQNCRISLLNSHFTKFKTFLDAIRAKDIEKAKREYDKNKLNDYGFCEFIKKDLYKDLIPNLE